jgi:prepilin peptidase CpaA
MLSITSPAAWLVTAILVEAAIIDGLQRRVPNWLTYHLALGGLMLAAYTAGTTGLVWSLAGLAVGLMLLLPLYAIGGMGAGDVKLLAAIGAWTGATTVFWSFAVSAIIGGIIALIMAAASGRFATHIVRFQEIVHEILVVRNPVELSERAAARKPTMLLLPYGIPLAIGTIAYFAYQGLLI